MGNVSDGSTDPFFRLLVQSLIEIELTAYYHSGYRDCCD